MFWIGIGIGLAAGLALWAASWLHHRQQCRRVERMLAEVCGDLPYDDELVRDGRAAIERAKHRAAVRALELRDREQLFAPRGLNEERN